MSPLHIAAHIGNEQACQWLLEQGKLRVHAVDKVGAPPTQPHPQWDTPLYLQPLCPPVRTDPAALRCCKRTH